jgi:cell division protein FtsQ
VSVAEDRVPTDPRLSRRRRAVARLRRRRIATRAAIAIAIAVAAWVALWSPLLRVRALKVVGGRHTTAADVVAAAGVTAADNILLLSTSDVARRTETLPWVRRARVERKLPGTVRVTLHERVAFMVLAAGDGRWTLDRRGRVLTEGRAARGLAVLAVGETAPVGVGERVPGAAARGGLRAYRSLPRRARRRVQAVLAPSPERIAFRWATGTLVRWGSARHPKAKGAVLRALLRRLRQEGRTLAYIDVSVPENPAVRASVPRAGRSTTRGG